MARLLFGLLLTLIALTATAQTARLDRVDVIEWGTYKITPAGPGDPPGSQGTISLANPSTVVEARLGVLFGMRYTPFGEPPGAALSLRLVTVLPGKGARNPATGLIVAQTEEVVSAVLGQPMISGYRFDDPWELLPGEWRFELWDKDRRVAEQRFTVVKR
jgi:Domain of unknown function (DUF3859)